MLVQNPQFDAHSSSTAPGTIAADLEPRNTDMEAGIPFQLRLQRVETFVHHFRNPATAETGHVNVVAAGFALVVVRPSFQVHQVEFIDQSMPLEKIDGSVEGAAIDGSIRILCTAKDLICIEMLLGGLDDMQNGAALPGHAYAALRQERLKSSRNFGLWQRHRRNLRLSLRAACLHHIVAVSGPETLTPMIREYRINLVVLIGSANSCTMKQADDVPI
jgi:hypothetical protein